jgi:hypothetical protein
VLGASGRLATLRGCQTVAVDGNHARVRATVAPGQKTGKDFGIQVTLGGGLNVDQHDNLLVGDQGSQVIDIFRQGTTSPFRQIQHRTELSLSVRVQP